MMCRKYSSVIQYGLGNCLPDNGSKKVLKHEKKILVKNVKFKILRLAWWKLFPKSQKINFILAIVLFKVQFWEIWRFLTDFWGLWLAMYLTWRPHKESNLKQNKRFCYSVVVLRVLSKFWLKAIRQFVKFFKYLV